MPIGCRSYYQTFPVIACMQTFTYTLHKHVLIHAHTFQILHHKGSELFATCAKYSKTSLNVNTTDRNKFPLWNSHCLGGTTVCYCFCSKNATFVFSKVSHYIKVTFLQIFNNIFTIYFQNLARAHFMIFRVKFLKINII